MLLTGLASGPAFADIVRLTNGRTMTVESCAFEGDMVIFKMPGGGEIRAHKSLVDEVLPDEVPFARVVAIEALAASVAAAKPQSATSAVRALVDTVAARVGLDRKLAHAVVSVESNYDPRAVSPKGAMGLMQIMPVVAASVRARRSVRSGEEPRSRHAPSRDAPGAVRSVAGAGGLQRRHRRGHEYGRVPPYRETQDYVRADPGACQVGGHPRCEAARPEAWAVLTP